MEMHLPKLLIFFWLSINYSSIFPIILSLSYAANPFRAIEVKCDGSVFEVDVDVPTGAGSDPNLSKGFNNIKAS